MLPDMSILKGNMDVFNHIVEARGLEVKQETHLGRTFTSIYKPGYRCDLAAKKEASNTLKGTIK